MNPCSGVKSVVPYSQWRRSSLSQWCILHILQFHLKTALFSLLELGVPLSSFLEEVLYKCSVWMNEGHTITFTQPTKQYIFYFYRVIQTEFFFHLHTLLTEDESWLQQNSNHAMRNPCLHMFTVLYSIIKMKYTKVNSKSCCNTAYQSFDLPVGEGETEFPYHRFLFVSGLMWPAGGPERSSTGMPGVCRFDPRSSVTSRGDGAVDEWCDAW